MKCLATKASLLRPYEEQIMTLFQLYEWASSNIPGVSFDYCSVVEYNRESKDLERRFGTCRTIPGTRRLHCFIPQSQDTVLTKRYSACNNSQVQRVTKVSTELEITGYVTCIYGSQWWLAQVLENDSGNGEVKLSLLSPNGPSRWYRYQISFLLP